MNRPLISPDDLVDVMEMADKLEDLIFGALDGSKQYLAVSALMNATTHCLLDQCETVEQARFFRNAFIQILDKSIKSFQIDIDKEPS